MRVLRKPPWEDHYEKNEKIIFQDVDHDEKSGKPDLEMKMKVETLVKHGNEKYD